MEWLEGWTLGVPNFHFYPLLASAILNPPSAPAVALFYLAESQLVRWAFEGNASSIIHRSRIYRERSEERFANGSYHVAICGPAGCGKSSLLNALMGLRNGKTGTASTGTVETTVEREKYQGHSSFDSLVLHDCPGAGTQRVPAKNYYYNQKLYLFDQLLIVHGERLGQVEIDIIKACILQRQRFVIIRSRSDELIQRIADDNDLDPAAAKERHIQITIDALASELRRAEVPDEVVKQLFQLCILVNKNDLRELTITDSTEWPDSLRQNEIHERGFLKYLRSRGVLRDY